MTVRSSATYLLEWAINENLGFQSLFMYRIVASTSPSRIEAHAGLYRSLMKGIFDPYVP